MLNISRKPGERIVVGENIFVTVTEISGHTVRLGIDAPRAVRVYREEIWLEIKAQNEAAARAATVTLPTGTTIPSLPPSPTHSEAPVVNRIPPRG